MDNLICKGNQVENIITRFYFKDEELRFEIILKIDNKEVVYNEFNDYQSYKSELALIMDAKRNNQYITKSKHQTESDSM